MEKYNIGITIGMVNDFKALESNALLMNAFYLYDNIEKTNKYNPIILICDEQDKVESKETTLIYYEKKYNIIYFNIYNIKNLDIIATVFYDFPKSYYKIMLSVYPNLKFIHISYGNSYIIDVSYYLYLEDDCENFNLRDKKNDNDDLYKEYKQILISPHFIYSKGYYQVKYNIPYDNILIAPYIWNTRISQIRNKDLKYNFHDISYDKIGINIGIFEANLHLIKNCMIPLYISEQFYNHSKYKKYLSSVHLTNIRRMVKKKGFIKNIHSLNIFIDKKMEIEDNAIRMPHYPIHHKVNLIICHQIYNELNYLHFELAYLGIPFIHNCTMIKDMGYYYEGFDINKAVNLIEYIYMNHNPKLNSNYNEFIKAYTNRNQDVINRFNTTNIINIKATENNLDKLFNE